MFYRLPGIERRKIEARGETLNLPKVPGVEWRTLIMKELRAEAVEENEDLVKLTGYAAVWDVWSEPIWGWFIETIRKAAFKPYLGEADVRYLFNHNPDKIMARTPRFLEAEEDDTGLLSQAVVDRRQSYTRDLLISIDRGDVTQMSFAVMVMKQRWTLSEDPDEFDQRELLELYPFDYSPVTYPAYPQTSVWIDGQDATRVMQRGRRDPEARAEFRSLITRSGMMGNQVTQPATPSVAEPPQSSVVTPRSAMTPSERILRARLAVAEGRMKCGGGKR